MTEKVRADLQKICDVIVATVPAVQIYLFGSYAYGQPHEDSDYDIYIVLEDGGPRPLDAAVAVRRALLPVDTGPLDILANHASAFSERCRIPTIEREVSQKGVLLYGREPIQRVG